MLNTVLGFTAEQVARSYAVPTRTMATRLVRAKRRIRDNRIPFRLPDRSQLPERMDAVLAAVYAAYVIEWSTGSRERDLPPEALHLAEVLAELVPDDPEVHGLAALVELSAARRHARHSSSGAFVPLASHDVTAWDAPLISRAHEHLRAAHPARVVGRYQLEAAVQAVHCARRETGRTDWATLLDLHRSLAVVAPSLGSATALAAVTAEVEGTAAGLALLDADAERTSRFQPAWATRAASCRAWAGRRRRRPRTTEPWHSPTTPRSAGTSRTAGPRCGPDARPPSTRRAVAGWRGDRTARHPPAPPRRHPCARARQGPAGAGVGGG